MWCFFHYPYVVQLLIYTGTLHCGEYLTAYRPYQYKTRSNILPIDVLIPRKWLPDCGQYVCWLVYVYIRLQLTILHFVDCLLKKVVQSTSLVHQCSPQIVYSPSKQHNELGGTRLREVNKNTELNQLLYMVHTYSPAKSEESGCNFNACTHEGYQAISLGGGDEATHMLP